eukprot:TRINITY_DN2888_c0_g1_i4.p1 TRINITY_DN2888_c0_g1~~TRINITY_DN2888_c0_g1_i4.p1  ORF type:complete len:105 (+),score=14.93 TRINITY_DN2888_c0_g1_i4:20-334(+)
MEVKPLLFVGYPSIGTQRLDMKKCYEAHDRHFDCLDSLRTKGDNHYECPTSFNNWLKNCDGLARRRQLENRYLRQRDERLYTQDSLADYNERNSSKISWPDRLP